MESSEHGRLLFDAGYGLGRLQPDQEGCETEMPTSGMPASLPLATVCCIQGGVWDRAVLEKLASKFEMGLGFAATRQGFMQIVPSTIFESETVNVPVD